MKCGARGSWRSYAAAIALITSAEMLSPAIGAAGSSSKPAPVPARPALAPVSLHAWAKSIGFEASWIEKNKKLRLKSRLNEIVFEADHREVRLNGTRVFLGEAPLPGKHSLTISPVDRDHLLIPLLAPSKLGPGAPVRVIALDAGHGGKDKGASNAALKLFEKDMALDVVLRLKPLLEARGYQVVLTRTDDTFIELGDRPARASKAGADLFLSVHFNAGPPPVNGIETYLVSPQYQRSTASEKLGADDNVAVPGNTWDGWNAVLGYSIHRQLNAALQCFDRGLKRARFVVIRDLATCPGVLIECGYLSNQIEAKRISAPAYRDRLAAAIAAGVDAYTVQQTVAPAKRSANLPAAAPPSPNGAARARPTSPATR